MKSASSHRPRGRWLTAIGCAFAVAVLYPTIALGDQDPLGPNEVGPSGFSSVQVTKKIESLASLGAGPASPAWPSNARINRPVVSAGQYAAMKAAAAKAPKVSKPATPAPLSVTSIVGSFAGPNQCGPAGELCWYPPDSNASVGVGATGQEVSITNSKISVFSKAGAPLADTKLATFFGYTAASLFDPRIHYDQVADRWFAMAEAFPESPTVQLMKVAVSNTSDATGGWCVFTTDVDWLNNDDFFDYPQMGNLQDALVFTANIFPAAGGYAGADAFGWPKAYLYNCKGFSYNRFTGMPGTTTPSNAMDASPRNEMIAQSPYPGASVLREQFKYPGNLNYSSIAASVMPIVAYGFPPNAPQAGSATLIDTLDGRFVNENTQYGDNLWATHTTGDFGFATPRFYNFDTAGAGVNTVKQWGNFFVSGTSYDWNASISAHQDGRAYVDWSNTDSSFPRMSVGGRVAADPAGTISQAAPIVGAGAITANGNPSRWGDYSSVDFESSTGIVATAFNELAQATGQWATRFVRFSVS